MIITLLINLVVLILGAFFSFFPKVDTLPTVAGLDLDATLVSGMAEINTVFTSLWYLQDIFYGFLALLLYYGIKLIARLFLGHRAPH